MDDAHRLATARFGVPLELPGQVRVLVGLVPTYAAIVLLYLVFFGVRRLRPLRAAISRLTWTWYFNRRYHDPKSEFRRLR